MLKAKRRPFDMLGWIHKSSAAKETYKLIVKIVVLYHLAAMQVVIEAYMNHFLLQAAVIRVVRVLHVNNSDFFFLKRLFLDSSNFIVFILKQIDCEKITRFPKLKVGEHFVNLWQK